MRIYSIIILVLFSSNIFAQCYKVGNFKGQSARASDNYVLSSDSLTGQSFNVLIAGENSRVSPDDISCHQTGNYSLVCISSNQGRSVIETWSVDTIASKALYTKNTSGHGQYDGITVFIGEIFGGCS